MSSDEHSAFADKNHGVNPVQERSTEEGESNVDGGTGRNSGDNVNGQASSNHKNNGIANERADVVEETGAAYIRTKDQNSRQADRQPLWICGFIVKHPRGAFGTACLAHIVIVIVTAILFLVGYDILPTNFTNVPLQLTTDETFLRGEAWNMRYLDPDILPRLTTSPMTATASNPLELFYSLEEQEGNVFTKENLKMIEKVENELYELNGFEKFCFKGLNGTCAKAFSVIRYFDGTYGMVTTLFEDRDYSNIAGVLSTAENHPKFKSALQYHLGKKSVINNTRHSTKSSITRSVIYFDSSSDENQLEEFLVEKVRPKLYKYVYGGIGPITFNFNNRILYRKDLNRQVILDLMLAGGSFGFIFIFMWFQTRSLFVTSLGIASILTSFLGANLIYRVVFDYRYFGVFHVLSVFIILGIGADDIFVFFDTWKATEGENIDSLSMRLDICYRRAASAMFSTSLTTMIAFLVSAFSPLLAVSSFGLFSGILVFVNYLSVITFFPTVVVLYHIKWKDFVLPCCRPCSSKVHPHDCDQTDNQPAKNNVIVRFFRGPYFRVVTHKVARWLFLLAFAGILAFLIYFAVYLKPEEEAVKIYKDDHNYGKANNKRLHQFRPSAEDQIIQVYMVWGLKNQDRSMCHKTDFEDCSGKTVWDEGFDLNPKPSQMALLDFCEYLRTLPRSISSRLKIRKNIASGELEVDCFMKNMNSFLKMEMNKTMYPNDTQLSLPVTDSKISSLVSSHPLLYNMSGISETFYRNFEVALSFWLMNGYTGRLTQDSKRFSSLLGESIDSLDTQRILVNQYLYYGTRLRYAAIVVNTSLLYGNLGYEEGIPIMDAWESFFKEQKDKMPPSLKSGFQCTPDVRNSWHWLKVQKTLANSAIMGIVIGIGLAFPVLVLSTQNIIIGCLATLTICCTTVSVVGLIPLSGWKLGVLESLNISLVVGLAVDYVVHLAEGYHIAPSPYRLERVRYMLGHVGISVISGAVSTLGASLFMLFAQILFFMQFGIFMFCTIGFSLLYSLGFFTILLALIGPQHETGSLRPVGIYLRNLVTGRKSADVTCESCGGKGFHAVHKDAS